MIQNEDQEEQLFIRLEEDMQLFLSVVDEYEYYYDQHETNNSNSSSSTILIRGNNLEQQQQQQQQQDVIRVGLVMIDHDDTEINELVACCEERDREFPYYDQYYHHDNTTHNSNSNSNSLGRCIICMDSHRTHAYVPCGHLCVCQSCAEKTMKTTRDDRKCCRCPICKQNVQQIMRIYLP